MKNIINPEYKLPLHTPVMLTEVLAALNIKPHGMYIDCTFGRGGHSRAILDQLDQNGRLLVCDLDPEAIFEANQLKLLDPRVSVFHGSFARITEVCNQNNYPNIDGVLLDLGVSSPQINNATRGFSFSVDGPLDMRMDCTQGNSAAAWLAVVTLEELIKVLKDYGQERFAKKIAENILIARAIKPITTTFELVEIIKKSCPKSYARFKHPATRTFQAIRIFINQELINLQQVLPQMVDLLSKTGRLVVISFHSLEDIIVKGFINKYSGGALSNNYSIRKFPITSVNIDDIKLKKIGKCKPTIQETTSNSRSRSALMRVAEKCV